MIKADQAITAVLRVTAAELARGLAPDKASAYDGFVELTQERADQATAAWNDLITNRPKSTKIQAARMEKAAYDACLAAAVAAMLTLAHFPFLDKIEFNFEEERAGMI